MGGFRRCNHLLSRDHGAHDKPVGLQRVYRNILQVGGGSPPWSAPLHAPCSRGVTLRPNTPGCTRDD